MSKEIAAALAAPFTGNGSEDAPRARRNDLHRTLTRGQVAQRLDDVLGLSGWQFEVKVADAQRFVVHGTLVAVIDGVTTVRQDFGYPNSAQDDEPYKSAASDALRRCAAQLGVGRSLYSSGTRTSLSVAPRAVSVRLVSQPQAATLPPDVAVAAAMLFAEGECPDHRTAWQFKPAGVSKAG